MPSKTRAAARGVSSASVRKDSKKSTTTPSGRRGSGAASARSKASAARPASRTGRSVKRRVVAEDAKAATTKVKAPAAKKGAAAKTRAPAAKTRAAGAKTKAPAAKTKAPAAKTKAPAAKTKATAAKTKATAAKTKATAREQTAPEEKKSTRAARKAGPSGGRRCAEPDCDSAVTTRGFCRLHYLKNWKAIKARERKAARKRVNAYVDELMHKVPVDYEERVEASRSSTRPSIDVEFTQAREDVEEMFREMGFDEEI